MGCIGVGGMGTGHLRGFLGRKRVRVVAVCDVYERQRQKAKSIVDRHYGDTGCATHNDFRELLGREDVDACVIATQDHWHVLIALEAARNGKDVYCEKSMGLSVADDQALRSAVNRYGVVFQFGTQSRSDARFRFACELVRNGRIGELHTILIGSAGGRPFPNQPPQPVPQGFDYDMWLGPAPWVPYTYHRCRPYSRKEGQGVWYRISDYSQGGGTMWGIHSVDIAQWANGTDHTGPVEVEGTGVFPKDGMTDCAISYEVEHKYANGVKMIHADHGTSAKHASDIPGYRWGGLLFRGTDGWVFVSRGYINAHPKSLLKSIIGPNEIHLYESNDHKGNFLDCIKTRRQTICPVDIAVRSDTICLQANIAMWLKRKLRWDPERERFTNDDAANRALGRAMRTPWHL
jgi:predicted dehydrogenase